MISAIAIFFLAIFIGMALLGVVIYLLARKSKKR